MPNKDQPAKINRVEKPAARSATSPAKVAAQPNFSTATETQQRLPQTPLNSHALQPHDLLRLQRTVGNHAVQRLLATRTIQAKLTVGAAHDPYEEEADRVAAHVMRMPASPALTGAEGGVQRKVEEDDEELQAKPLADTITPLVQRTPQEDEELQTTRTSAAGSFETGAEFENRLNATRGGGTPLPTNAREFMEPRFGADFSGVRLHTGSESAQLNREVSAQAFTLGSDIYLGEGKTDVTSSTGRQLLAHELTHVVQQKGMSIRRNLIQRDFWDTVTDAAHNQRKLGAEITEDGAGGNRMTEQASTPAWNVLTPLAKNAVFTNTVNLPDHTGAAHNWYIASATAPNTNYFVDRRSKHRFMKWGNVNFTEDHGDIEWIIDHPNTPQGVTYYRDRLRELNTARQDLHTAVSHFGPSPYYLSRSQNGGNGEVLKLETGGGNRASVQITLESTDRAKTKKALLEGLSHGIDQNFTDTQRAYQLRGADADLTQVVTAEAQRFTLPGVDWELIVAYIIADLAHKTVMLSPSAVWGNLGGDVKSWRRLFPKSHPSQILRQAMNTAPTATDVGNVQNQLTANASHIVKAVKNLLAKKVYAKTTKLDWPPQAFQAHPTAGDRVFNHMTPHLPDHPAGEVGIRNDLGLLLAANAANFDMLTEYTAAQNALTDLTATNIGVARSGNFAVHAPATTGFAVEDRGEIPTTFPGLDETYDRIKKLVNRY